jgi:hypothetical protein
MMSLLPWVRRLFLCVAVSTICLPSQASATLGGNVSSVAAVQARLGARLQVLERDRFVIHELETPAGVKVRELVGRESGKVFAVFWSGGWRPNLRELMGEHYDRFIAGTRGRRASRGVVRIELPGMVVVMGGQLRNFFGQVVLTELWPAGLGHQDLR